MTTPQSSSRYESKYWRDAAFCDYSSPDIVAWKLARSAIEHENLLVNHRMTWFLTSQAFLFSAFVLLFLTGSKDDLHEFKPLLAPLLAAVGLFGGYTCLVAQDGLNQAFLATDLITSEYVRLTEQNAVDPIVPPLHHWVSAKLFSQQKLPVATLLLWCLLLLACVAYALPEARKSLEQLTVVHIVYFLGVLFVFGLGYSLRGSRFFRHSVTSSSTSGKR